LGTLAPFLHPVRSPLSLGEEINLTLVSGKEGDSKFNLTNGVYKTSIFKVLLYIKTKFSRNSYVPTSKISQKPNFNSSKKELLGIQNGF